MTTVYRMYDSGERLLYVGITDRGPRRWRQHIIDKPWWGEVETIRLEHTDTRTQAEAAEFFAILDEGPAHNIMRPATTCSLKWREPITLPNTSRALLIDRLLRDNTGEGAAEAINRLRSDDHSWTEVATYLTEQTGVSIGREGLRQWDKAAEVAA